MKEKLEKSNTSMDRKILYGMIKDCGLSLSSFLVPLFLSFLAAFLEGFSLSLLAPTLDLVVQGAVDAKKESWLVGKVQDFLSQFFNFDTKMILVMLVFGIFFSEIFKYILSFLSSVKVSNLIHQFSNRLRIKLFTSYLSFGKLYFDSHSRGEMYQIITTNTRIIGNSLKVLHNALFQLITLGVYFVMMIFISWQLTAITMLIFPLLHYLAQSRIKEIRKTSIDISASNSSLGKRISNALASIPLVKIYGTEEEESNEFIQVSKQIETSENEIDRLVLMLEPIRDGVVLICIALLVGFIWLVSAVTNSVGVGKYLVFILLLKRISRFIGSINVAKANIAEVYGPLKQIETIIYSKQETFVVPDGSNIFKKLESDIIIQDLSFNYPGKRVSLHNINLTIKRGKSLAIVGRSGAGKTTLINILARFYDCAENKIIVNGNDLRSYSAKTWTEKIAMVGQDSFLFYASLKDNLVYGLKDVSEKALLEAIEKSGMLEFVSHLPEGLDTIVGDGGVKLSGGEKQRISIARAFLRNPEIIILDEPTSALDSQTEKEVQDRINELCKNKTVIIIAHRLATVKHSEWIVVMEAGRIVEQGSLSDLTNFNGKFKKYWDAQRLPG